MINEVKGIVEKARKEIEETFEILRKIPTVALESDPYVYGEKYIQLKMSNIQDLKNTVTDCETRVSVWETQVKILKRDMTDLVETKKAELTTQDPAIRHLPARADKEDAARLKMRNELEVLKDLERVEILLDDWIRYKNNRKYELREVSACIERQWDLIRSLRKILGGNETPKGYVRELTENEIVANLPETVVEKILSEVPSESAVGSPEVGVPVDSPLPAADSSFKVSAQDVETVVKETNETVKKEDEIVKTIVVSVEVLSQVDLDKMDKIVETSAQTPEDRATTPVETVEQDSEISKNPFEGLFEDLTREESGSPSSVETFAKMVVPKSDPKITEIEPDKKPVETVSDSKASSATKESESLDLSIDQLMMQAMNAVDPEKFDVSPVIHKEDLNSAEFKLKSETHPRAKKLTPENIVDKTLSIDDLLQS